MRIAEFIINHLTYELLETFNVPTKWVNQLKLLPTQAAFTEIEFVRGAIPTVRYR